MSESDLVLVSYDQTDTQGVADSVVKYLRRDHGYEVLVVGPGHGRELGELDPAALRRARFFLELDAVSGLLYHAEGLERLSCPKLAWFVDSHKKPHFQQRIALDFDLVFFAMLAWGGLFGERGRWLPVHFDPEWFALPPQEQPTFDVGFVGSRPQERTRALQGIARRHGLSLLLETTTGPEEKQRTAELYARCKVVFNQHVANDLNFRMVEGPACGRLLLTDAQRNGQYELFRDREHLVYYKDDQDLEAALLHYLGHDAERERVAAAGQALVRSRHSTPARVQALVYAAEELVRARGGGPRPARAAQDANPGFDPARRLLVVAGEPGPETASLGARVRELVARGARVEVLALGPLEPIPGVELHLAPGPALPRLAVAPGARRALECVRLLDAAAALLADPGRARAELLLLDPAHAPLARGLGRPFATLEGTAVTARQAAEVRYDRDYMLRYGYCVRSPEEARLKAVQAGVIVRVLAPRRALVAGCAAGELLLPLKAGGVDAWGFDAADGLEGFVYPEVRERVLSWDVAELGTFPFERAGGRFDTLVAIDLFEHVEEAKVDCMLDGVAAGFERLALVISSSPAFEGHVCVKPFPWWLERLEARGFELLEEPRELSPGETGTYGVQRFEGVAQDMSERLVFLRRRATPPAPVAEPAARDRPGAPRPDVSVCLVCCDRPDVLEATLETTRASLVACPAWIEWLAFDNGSSEPVRRVLEDMGLDLVLRAGRNLGLAPALDALHRAAGGRYVLTLEDDWACESATHAWLDLALRILDTQPDVGLVRLRRLDDGQCGHFKRHRREVALRHHPWSVEPLPAEIVETRVLDGERFYVAAARWVNWTHNPTLCRREVLDWIGPLSDYLLDPRDHRPREGHPGLEGAIDLRWRAGPWKAAKLLLGPFTHIGARPARVETS